jgi:hypothetical protein
MMTPARYRVTSRVEETADTVTLVCGAVSRALSTVERGDLLGLRSPYGMHWDWVCDRLDARQAARLEHYTLSQLRVANRGLRRPVADLVLR